ncbi:MAG: hypothetical protein KDB53_21510, partial [Planctomycetes bacterium]|nr:hypothetical protein [Planctomycetota bacterium]
MLWLRTTKGDRPDRKELPASVAAELREWIGDRTGPVLCDRHDDRISHRQAQRRSRSTSPSTGIVGFVISS